MNSVNSDIEQWKNSNMEIFWAEIAPCDHLIQIYENDIIFLDTLEGFASSGFLAGESVVVLAKRSHIENLNKRLVLQGFNLQVLAANDLYITVDADIALAEILVNNWIEENLFEGFVKNILDRARGVDRKVRAFGELVAVLWEQGHCGVTVHLEHLWHRFRHKNDFMLFCAYPKIGFTQSPKDSIDEICKTHSIIIDGQVRPVNQIYYKSTA